MCSFHEWRNLEQLLIVWGIGLDNKSPEDAFSSAPGFSFRHVDLTEYDKTLNALRGCNAVIHLAALPNPRDYGAVVHNMYARSICCILNATNSSVPQVMWFCPGMCFRLLRRYVTHDNNVAYLSRNAAGHHPNCSSVLDQRHDFVFLQGASDRILSTR